MSRNRVIGSFEDAIEQGQQAVKSGVKQGVTDFAQSAKGQITGSQSSPSQGSHQTQAAPSDQGSNEHGASNPSAQQQSQKTDEERVEFLKDLYGKNDHSSGSKTDKSDPKKGSGSVAQAVGVPQKDPNEGKTPEEAAKLQALRIQLHQNYYQNLVNRPKSKDEPVTEKLEREEREAKMAEFQTQKEKPPPINPTVKQGTGENVVGASG
jgi:hypothetical protein